MRFLLSEKGGVLVFTLLVMVTMLFLGAAVLNMAQAEISMARYQFNEAAAFYLAEGGLQYALARLERDPDLRGVIPAVALPAGFPSGGGGVSLKVEEVAKDYLQVVSTGEKERMKRTLVMGLWVLDHGFLLDSGDEAVISGCKVEIRGAGQGNSPKVVGGIAYGGDLVVQGQGGAYDYAEQRTLTLLPLPFFAYRKGFTPLAARDVPGSHLQGCYYVDGDLRLNGPRDGITGKGVLVIGGRLDLTGGAYLDGDFCILAGEGIKTAGNINLKGLLFSPGPVQVGGNVEITGRVMSSDAVILMGNTQIRTLDGDTRELLQDLPLKMVVRDKWYRR